MHVFYALYSCFWKQHVTVCVCKFENTRMHKKTPAKTLKFKFFLLRAGFSMHVGNTNNANFMHNIKYIFVIHLFYFEQKIYVLHIKWLLVHNSKLDIT